MFIFIPQKAIMVINFMIQKKTLMSNDKKWQYLHLTEE